MEKEILNEIKNRYPAVKVENETDIVINLDIVLKRKAFLDGAKYYKKIVQNNVVLPDVITSAYLMKIDGETTIVKASNLADAMDKAEANCSKDYSFIHSNSFPLLH